MVESFGVFYLIPSPVTVRRDDRGDVWLMGTLIVIVLLVVVAVVLVVVLVRERQNYRRDLQRLETLLEIGKDLNSAIRLRPLLKRIMDTATSLLSAQAASVLILDPVKQELFFELALGEKGTQLKEIRLKVGEGIAGWVAANGVPFITDDVREDPRFKKSISEKIDYQNKAMMCVPIFWEGQTLGVLQVINKSDGGAFSKAELDLLVDIAAQVAVALKNAQAHEDFYRGYSGVLQALAGFIDARSSRYAGHSRRVAALAQRIARFMGFEDDELDLVNMAALAHDIGKVELAAGLLERYPELSPAEMAVYRRHPAAGALLIPENASTQVVRQIIGYHHEWWDGSGYPEGRKGEEVPLAAYIVGIANAFDELQMAGVSAKKAAEELRKTAGVLYHPRVTEALLWCLAEPPADRNQAG
ncbi:MAG: GAF domain-containing protein [Heliobacteriaceae bacterium]|nr:GAF domain-containing protein [Heliobacteriaceae bacterium]MDD4588297.1 GAF domain-containing protein [Heliobacteriaceae bacterium]